MIKFIHCADIHLGKIQNNLEQRFLDFGAAFRYVIEETLHREADFLLIAGDLFDKRNINARTLKQAVEILQPLKDAKIPVIAIEGNHDKAFLRDKESWISFLAHRGYIVLLRPRFEGGEMILEPYDPETCQGCYLDLTEKIRVYGMGYLGRAVGNKLEDLSGQLSDDKINILLLHAMVGRMGGDMIGSIPKSDVACLHQQVTYLALGHGHNCYVVEKDLVREKIEDWESIETPSEVESAASLEETKKREVAQLNLFDLLGVSIPASNEVLVPEEEQVYRDVENLSGCWGHNPGSIEHCRIDEANHRQGFFYVEMDEKEEEILHIEHIPTKQRPAMIIKMDITGATDPQAVYQRVQEEVTEKVGEVKELLLRLVLRGEIHFDLLEIDEAEIRRIADEICAPLLLEIDIRANLPQLSFNDEDQVLDRRAIEKEVLTRRVEQSARWRHLGDELVQHILELKEDLLQGLPREDVVETVLSMVGDPNEDS